MHGPLSRFFFHAACSFAGAGKIGSGVYPFTPPASFPCAALVAVFGRPAFHIESRFLPPLKKYGFTPIPPPRYVFFFSLLLRGTISWCFYWRFFFFFFSFSFAPSVRVLSSDWDFPLSLFFYPVKALQQIFHGWFSSLLFFFPSLFGATWGGRYLLFFFFVSFLSFLRLCNRHKTPFFFRAAGEFAPKAQVD